MQSRKTIAEDKRGILYSVTSSPERKLLLSDLKAGIPALTEVAGAYMVEACLVCMEDQSHQSGVLLSVAGTFSAEYSINWEGTVTDSMRRYWKDEEVTTEHAAYGIAILLVRELTGYTAVERSSKGPGFDYWLGNNTDDDLIFQNMARLEVSGIRSGSDKSVGQRVKQKLKQTERSDGDYPAYIAVIEFSKPMSQVVKK
jgi:hypothetical protein